ncbi:hypothetical protein NDU88_003485 [Pleurodeles waltl]|uniref:Uncharacterized protein n=1 Tax=Pleurodeles waltl TaxID=8319 RepID=A0AAV7TR96_PLEWA|nr:hypothetical protein NDU88_003485 [Pleurodeles waltl]
MVVVYLLESAPEAVYPGRSPALLTPENAASLLGLPIWRTQLDGVGEREAEHRPVASDLGFTALPHSGLVVLMPVAGPSCGKLPCLPFERNPLSIRDIRETGSPHG